MELRGAPAAPPGGLSSTEGRIHPTISVAAPPGTDFALAVEGRKKSSEELGAKQELSAVEKPTEDNRSKQSVMATPGNATAVADSPRVSKMVKSGLNFVIPKNKLLGAMVPVNKSATKWEPLDPKNEELKPPARKTKWGADLTQDAVVKKGRALALQTRAEQLAAQLESGSLDIDCNEETRSPSPPPLYDTLGHRMNTREGRKREQLDIERREAIGECMKLNSAYKPPSGYKPVAKEAKLYIPKKAKKHGRKRKKGTDFPGYLGRQSTFGKAKKHKKRVRFEDVSSSPSSSSDSSSDSSEEDRKGKKQSKKQRFRKGKKKAKKSKSRPVNDSSTEDMSTYSSDSEDKKIYANKRNFYKANQYDFLEDKSKKVRKFKEGGQSIKFDSFSGAKEHPGYNFIGLILGPRGNTQKRMEAETGAKITIRGKGAVKEGKIQSARNGKDTDGAFEELHVHISADSFEKVDAALVLIEPLLTPVDEDRNMHKMKQLRELAEMNGTLNDFTKICSLCGEAGHREWQCPKEKLQTFQANVTCNICGDAGHPSIDCPRKNSGQVATFDKEYPKFLEELGTGLEGVGTAVTADQPSGSNASRPMLLTTLGAQPVPARWMAPPVGANSLGISTPRGPPIGVGDAGAFLRFPAPPTFQGFNAYNPLVPRFVQPSVPIRGPPFQGVPMPMMANMLPPFRVQSPNPAGFASPALPLTSASVLPPSTNSTMPKQTQDFRPAGEGLNGAPSLPEGSQFVSITSDSGTNAAALAASSAASSFALSCPSDTNPQFQLSNVGTSTVSTVVTSGQSFRSMSSSNLLPLSSAKPVLPLASAPAASPSPAAIPLIRPGIPSIRPALPGPLVQQGSGGLGQALPNGIPSLGGTGNVALPPANTSFPRLPQPFPGAMPFWPRPPQQIALSFERPLSAASPPLLQPLASSNNPHLQPPARVSSPVPMTAPLQQGHSMIRAPRNLHPPVSSSFTVVPPHNQFSTNLTSQPSNHSSARPGFPPLLSPQMRGVNPGNVALPGGIPASIQQIPQQNVFRPLQDLPRSSVPQNAQFTQQSNSFPHRAEFPPLGAQARPEFRSPGAHQQGILVSPPSLLGSRTFSRPPFLGPSQEGLNRTFSPNIPGPPNPSPHFVGGLSSVNASWDPRNRPDMQQMNGRPGMTAIRGWNPEPQMRPQQPPHAQRPQIQEVDPEYEKLMASVGVL
ncbi:hypothetical protein L7F22_009885 [Adiantum nelumboides]|nr:hypothetical protein [Adiantum nelumboides]